MSCRESQRLFSRYLDERASERERAALDAHVAGCARCRAELARWLVPSRALRALGAAPPPDGLAENSWRAAFAAASRAPSFEEGFVWAARRIAAAGALTAALVWIGLFWRGPGLDSDSGSSAGDAALAELASAPDVTEVAMSLWAAEPAAEAASEAMPERTVDGE